MLSHNIEIGMWSQTWCHFTL